jgi:hypothetical protein
MGKAPDEYRPEPFFNNTLPVVWYACLTFYRFLREVDLDNIAAKKAGRDNLEQTFLKNLSISYR